MNIEESIKILDKFTTEHKLFNIKHSDGLEEAIETLLTAYEKQSKEIEELNKSDESKEQSSMKYYNLYNEWVDKIKEELEAELKKEEEKNKEYKDMIIRHKKQLKQAGIYGYDYDLEILKEE